MVTTAWPQLAHSLLLEKHQNIFMGTDELVLSKCLSIWIFDYNVFLTEDFLDIELSGHLAKNLNTLFREASNMLTFLLFYFTCLFIFWTQSIQTCQRTHVEVRKQLVEASSLLLRCRFWQVNSGHQVWWQVPLPTPPSHWLYFFVFVVWSIGILLWWWCLSWGLTTQPRLALNSDSP